LTHLDARGRASMVDVSSKPATRRTAVASAVVRLDATTRDLLLTGQLPKGEALAVARIAGIQAAKDTPRLIPLCHSLPLEHAGIEFAADGADGIRITATAVTTGPTGVEMEAMVAASLAALTVYDMVKARCRGAVVEAVRLVHKSGGKSGRWDAPGAGPTTTGGAS
jgi:cyclic pyranopterin monophosphate synthase